jgi:tetratricopeptide (TPR) repeat protein
LRQYAWERLIATGRLGDARDAHAGYYATLVAEQAALMGVSGRQVGALDRLDADYDNLRAALAHLIEDHQAEAAVRMVRRLSGFFNIRHPREGLGWFRQVIAIADDLPAKTRARLLGDAAFAAMSAGDNPAQAHHAQSAIDAGGVDAPAVAYWLLGQWHERNNELPLAVEHARQAVALAAAAGEVAIQVSATGQLVAALAALGEEAEARRHIPELIKLAEGLGNPTMTATAGANAATALALLSRHDEAVALFEQALANGDAAGPYKLVPPAAGTRSKSTTLTRPPPCCASPFPSPKTSSPGLTSCGVSSPPRSSWLRPGDRNSQLSSSAHTGGTGNRQGPVARLSCRDGMTVSSTSSPTPSAQPPLTSNSGAAPSPPSTRHSRLLWTPSSRPHKPGDR